MKVASGHSVDHSSKGRFKEGRPAGTVKSVMSEVSGLHLSLPALPRLHELIKASMRLKGSAPSVQCSSASCSPYFLGFCSTSSGPALVANIGERGRFSDPLS